MHFLDSPCPLLAVDYNKFAPVAIKFSQAVMGLDEMCFGDLLLNRLLCSSAGGSAVRDGTNRGSFVTSTDSTGGGNKAGRENRTRRRGIAGRTSTSVVAQVSCVSLDAALPVSASAVTLTSGVALDVVLHCRSIEKRAAPLSANMDCDCRAEFGSASTVEKLDKRRSVASQPACTEILSIGVSAACPFTKSRPVGSRSWAAPPYKCRADWQSVVIGLTAATGASCARLS